MRWLKSPAIRPLDPEFREFHLNEEVAAPKAAITGGRVAVWIYSAGDTVREIVISGHAELYTCTRVSQALFDAFKQIRTSHNWMISAGTGHIRLENTLSEAESTAVTKMLQKFESISKWTGLVETFHCEWDTIMSFRSDFEQQRRSRPAKILFPEALPFQHIADYIAIIADQDPERKPFSFQLRGWDYDCPEYQNVADRHLGGLGRALIEDALRRRQTYRSWLKDWMNQWIYMLHDLAEPEAENVKLQIPQEEENRTEKTQETNPKLVCGPEEFLTEHARRFVGATVRWPYWLLRRHRKMPYMSLPDSALDAPRYPREIQQIDFPRCLKFGRPMHEDEEPHTDRKDTTKNLPDLISHCLDNILMMDQEIKPYEQIANRRRGDVEPTALDENSRKMLIDTMIRGWPSFYLDGEEDRAVFKRWSDRCRERIWKVMLTSAAKAGIAPEVFLQECVVYDVRFDSDFGCSITPRMLFDNKSYAVAHGTRAGASVVVPLWPRRCRFTLPKPDDASNRDLAVRSVQCACDEADRPGGASFRVASLLRSALNWHPVVAGQLIFAEWKSRLGNWRESEQHSATLLLETVELLARGRSNEAQTRCLSYLQSDPQPVPDAQVLLALSEVFEYGELGEQYRTLSREREALLKQLAASIDSGGSGFWLEVVRLEEMEKRLATLDRERRGAPTIRQLIETALADPNSVAETCPLLSRAARNAPGMLRSTLELEDLTLFLSSDARRYTLYKPVVQARALLALYVKLNRITHDIDAFRVPAESVREIIELNDAVWMPQDAQAIITNLRNEFVKGGIDTLHSETLKSEMSEAARTCLSAAEGLLDKLSEGITPLESVVLPIHIGITFDHAFAVGLDRMLRLAVPLGHAIHGNWTMLDHDTQEIPPGAELRFDADSGIVSLVFDGQARPILGVSEITPEERNHLAELLSSPTVWEHAQGRSESAAEHLLNTLVTPTPSWQRWRDALGQVREELILVLSRFPGSVSLFPDYTFSLTKVGHKAIDSLDHMVAFDAPALNWDWQADDQLASMLGKDALPRKSAP